MSDFGIGAKLQCYKNVECTEELDYTNGVYSFRLGPSTGFNGTDGDYLSQRIYIKNTGDTDALDVSVYETGDENTGFFKIKAGTSKISESYIELGNIIPDQVVELIIYSIIPKKTVSVDNNVIDFSIRYNSLLKDKTGSPYYIDATKNDNVEYIETTTYTDGDKTITFEEFKIINFDSTDTSHDITMYPPIRIKYEKVNDVSLDNKNVHAGHLFGYGPYGEPLYGQEGLIHITDSITAEVPIMGEKIQSIAASYSILAKYNGTETTIEDIQSYYTSRYMMLGCYDGPALPLWLDEEEK